MPDRCNLRKCLDQKNGFCMARSKDIVDGRCQSIAWCDDLGSKNAPPIERKNGSLRRPDRRQIK